MLNNKPYKIKAIACCKVLLSYPDFSKLFHIHTDASHYQLGAVISQNNHPIAFYSCKLQPAQVRYTTTERELLSIIKTLKRILKYPLRSTICGPHRPSKPYS
jgi:hypothetical protein